jgi:flagellar hook-basal body complex protein FliE
MAESAGSEESSASFADLLKGAVETVRETEEAVQKDQMLLATGEVDNPHTVTINMAKADLALQTLVQVRNKAIDAYKEIMQMPL